ncbi:MAG: hypothetical protein SFY68_05135 [Candidatus Sumerlaeia bacterium]|nr:hypothetical protein [Candidatus Sumerlaeia bacterium]
MTSPSPPSKLWSVAAPSLLLVCTLALGTHYFLQEKTKAALRQPAEAFYHRIQPGWIRFTENELRHAVLSGAPSDFEQLVVRGALIRWQQRHRSLHPFENQMAAYEDGLWISPAREVWESHFQELESEWVAFSTTTIPFQDSWAQADHTAGDSVQIQFPTGTPTAHLGDTLVLTYPFQSQPLPDFVCYWSTEKLPGFSAFRARRGEPHRTEGRVEFRFEFSSEPAWIAPGVNAKEFRVVSSFGSIPAETTFRFERTLPVSTPLENNRNSD